MSGLVSTDQSLVLTESSELKRYRASLDGAIGWLMRSVKGKGNGSAAYFGVWGKWSRPYPETTGYIIVTLLDYARFTSDQNAYDLALSLGDWLLEIQDKKGYWHGGTHPAPAPNPSIFNTAQILLGLNALYRETKNSKWLDSAAAGARWLADGVNDKGQWELGNYRQGFNPSYYTRVAWPMLDTWALSGDNVVRESAERVLQAIAAKRKDNGVISGWGFDPGKPAFTHTIAYTIRGFLESARILDNWEAYGQPVEAAMDHLYKQAELKRGRLAGAYNEDWSKVDTYTCLTGNAQTAICLLMYDEKQTDLRLVNAACKLVDNVCDAQSLGHIRPGIRGGVPGSKPIWGRYLMMRYPNWAAKFHADALMLLMNRLSKEGL